jgi:UDP-N-acetylglucosamine--N-acetylmuramyl-(pentapeptide) pyrophosphoryl-undecaprenol N-acetylglucosamine transferase
MRIIVSGGGTGGHISPVLAVVTELARLDKTVEILYIGSEEGQESKIIPQTGIKFVGIAAGKFRRYHTSTLLNLIDPTTLFANIADFFRFVRGYFQSREIIAEFDPDVVFAKGGYVSLPVGLAARSLHYPLVIHESDSIMGMSNKLLAKRADKVCVSYPVKSYQDLDREKLVYSGNPVRSDIYGGTKAGAVRELNLDADLPTIMIIGGSQGSLVINQVVSESLGVLLKKYQIIHVSGERDYDWLGFQAEKLDPTLAKNYHLFNYLSGNLKDAYVASDLVISRAGNNVIAELAALHIPTILIPLSSSANSHQLSNAKIVSRMGAAMLLLQDNLSSKTLIRKIDYLFDNPDEMRAMKEKIATLATPDAAKIVATEIYEQGTIFAQNTAVENEEGNEEERT